MRVLSCLIASALVLSFSANVLAGPARETGSLRVSVQMGNSITGFVFAESRTPISMVYVELLNDVYSTISRVQTNGSGIYGFRNLPPGQYNVRVLSSGTQYEEQTRAVSLIPVSPVGRGAVSEQIDFYLKAKRQGGGPTGAPGVVFAQEVPDEAKRLYESGVAALDGKNEAEGFDKLKRSLEVFPDYFMALDRLGTEYVMRGYHEAAYVLLTKAVEVNPKSFSANYGLGVSLFRLDRTDQAIDHLNTASRLNDQSPNAHLWIGIALHKKNNLAAALKAMLRADELSNGTSADVHWQLARVYKDQKNYNKAAAELELFLKLKPDAQNAAEIRDVIAKLKTKQ